MIPPLSIETVSNKDEESIHVTLPSGLESYDKGRWADKGIADQLAGHCI